MTNSTVAGTGLRSADLEERVRLLEAIVENFPGGISLFDTDLRMVVCNEQQKRMLDYPDHLFAGGCPTLEDIFRFNAERGEYGPGDVEGHVQARLARVRERRPHAFERTRPNGTIVEIRGVPIRGGGFVTTYLDVTEHRRAQATIAHMAHHDSLTGLPNRTLLLDRLDQAIARAKRGEKAALHYLDLDRFKPVNDTYGHAVGDLLLKSASARLLSSIRETDTAARLGGDEFVVLQVGIGSNTDAAILARRLIASVSAPYDIADTPIEIGTSIGIALAPLDGGTADELLLRADQALYRCKTFGRGRFGFASEDSSAPLRCLA